MAPSEQITQTEFVIAAITALALLASTAMIELHKREHDRAMEPVPTKNARLELAPAVLDSVSRLLDIQESLRG